MTQRSFPPHQEWRVIHKLLSNGIQTTITVDGQSLQDILPDGLPPTWTLTWTATSEVRMDS